MCFFVWDEAARSSPPPPEVTFMAGEGLVQRLVVALSHDAKDSEPKNQKFTSTCFFRHCNKLVASIGNTKLAAWYIYCLSLTVKGTEKWIRKIPTQHTCCYRKTMYVILNCLLYGIAHYLYIPFEPHATFCTDIIGVAIPGTASTLAAVCPTNLESLVPHVITFGESE